MDPPEISLVQTCTGVPSRSYWTPPRLSLAERRADGFHANRRTLASLSSSDGQMHRDYTGGRAAVKLAAIVCKGAAAILIAELNLAAPNPPDRRARHATQRASSAPHADTLTASMACTCTLHDG